MNRHLCIRMFATALLLTATLALPGAARAAADPSVMHVDGYISNMDSRCPTLREHDGKTYGLAGDIGGLQSGDHVRLEGRLTDSRACGGSAVNVSLVQAIWADDNHRTTYYDHLQNGSFAQWAAANRGYSPRGRRNGYRHGEYRSDYGNYGDRSYAQSDRRGDLRSVTGRLAGYRGNCALLRGNDGRYYGLTGDLQGFERGDRVKVLGFLGHGACGDRTLEVEQIGGRS